MEIVFRGLTPKEIINKLINTEGVFFTSTGMRDAGQSDYKNRHRMIDLNTLAPFYNKMGLFSSECHGGARWHVGIMNRKESPFEEIRTLRESMPNVLLQTLIRETNLWGYRPYPRNVIEYVVSEVDIDVWRCFSFLNDVRNMRAVAEVVMKRGRIFEPAISFTQADWADDAYYLSVISDMVSLCGGTGEIILCVKDMAGLGSPRRIGELVNSIKQKWPEMVVQYHRHTTDGLALPALLAAVQNGAKLVDVQEDSLTRSYGQPPILSARAYLEEAGIKVNLDKEMADASVQKARNWVGHYQWAESPFKGFDYNVTQHRMPGGAFPSSFEQASQGGFLEYMPYVLRVMSLYNKIIKYFDVTPGSQITWVTCSGLVNNYAKEKGVSGIKHLCSLLGKFLFEKNQVFEDMDEDAQEEMLQLFRNSPGDFKNLLLGNYGKLPVGWPADWVYKSAFGGEWRDKLKERKSSSPLDAIGDDDLRKQRETLEDAISREASEEEFILYLMHPKDLIVFLRFREKYGETPNVLPTPIWRNGLAKPGDKVEFDLWGKPFTIDFISKGKEHGGLIHVVLRVNNATKVFKVETPRVKKKEIRLAKGNKKIGSPINGTVWRIGNPERGKLHEGDIIHKGEEILNLEAMKMETAIMAPYDSKIVEICVGINDAVIEKQLLYVIEELKDEEKIY